MRKTFYLTILLSLVIGCSTTDSPEPNSSGVPNNNEQTESVQEIQSTTPPNQPLTVPPNSPEPATQKQIEQYINGLANKGFAKDAQGVWIQSGNTLLANYQGTVPLPAASLSKVATTLAALQKFGPDHQFITLFGTTGTIKDGVLEGDLIVQGGEDPFFVWEEAIVVGNLLNEIGIKKVTGNLIIVDKFYMNFETDPQKIGDLLKQGFNSPIWSAEVFAQYDKLPSGTPDPEVEIAGSVNVTNSIPSNFQPLVRHYSFPVAELLKKMNSYSNNKMAQIFADAVGGAKMIAKQAASATGVPESEIHLINGSGLGVDNRISPRAAVAMFLAIEDLLLPYNMNIADVFAIVGQDEGILDTRSLPKLSVIKSGSLDDVSGLVGALPTRDRGTVWFSIINFGDNVKEFRSQQEIFLKSLVNQWGAVQYLPLELTPNPQRENQTSRSEIVETN